MEAYKITAWGILSLKNFNTQKYIMFSFQEMMNTQNYLHTLSDFNIELFDNKELISFAINNNLNHNFSNFNQIVDTLSLSIDKKYIESTIYTYFGIEKFSNHQSIEEYQIKYEDGLYYIPMADGEGIRFGQVCKVDRVKDIIRFYTNIYSESDCMADIYTPIEDWSEEDKSCVSLIGQKIISVKEISDKSGKRYIIVNVEEV